MFGYNPKGDGMVYAHKFYPETQTAYIAYGFVPAPSTNGKRDDYFNEENFTSGGLEAGFSYNQASDGGYLSTQNDFGQMDHEVSCTYAGLGDNALEFQIYDNSKFRISLHVAQLKARVLVIQMVPCQQVSCHRLDHRRWANRLKDHDGTISAGNIRAYQAGTFDTSSLTAAVDTPLPEVPGCQVARQAIGFT